MDLEGPEEGVLVPMPSTEIIEIPNPIEQNREIPNLGLFHHPNLLFHLKILVQRSQIFLVKS